MKFALVNGQRQEPQPNLSGECPGCGNPMVARCGEVRVWHWAHRGRRHCDSWWENETEWHRKWKGQFPVDWQEIIQHAEDGERHIADVKTDDGWVIEFQHSYIKPEERRSREGFYSKLIWVVDGVRRKTDKARFQKALDESVAPFPEYALLRRGRSHGGGLLRDWAGSRAHVFFDFGDKQVLWWLIPNANDIDAYVTRISCAEFIENHRRTATQGANDFDSVAEAFTGLVADYESHRRAQSEKAPRQDFERDFARMSRRNLQGRNRPRRYRR
ncbi:MAG: hypothetical protein IIA11_03420 [Proteobacteria bacterium]|nr:hypothetical protein [Pseudomonadota bacterium]